MASSNSSSSISTSEPRAAGAFKEAFSTDLLFLIDTTGSMSGQINAAKEQIRSIVASVISAFNNEVELRVAVVGYKDHGDSPNIQFLDFTPSAEVVREFLTELTASGGDDIPEDVLGGIKQALNANWKQQTRCIIHIADAPPHGRNLHDLGDIEKDNYPNPGSEPHGLAYEPLLRQMIGMNISYALLKTNGSTDRMVLEFGKHYATAFADCTLHPSNKHREQLLGGANDKAWLLFEEAELGTSFSALEHLVVRVVQRTAPRAALRLLAPVTRKKQSFDSEDDDEAELETEPPQWDSPEWFDHTLTAAYYSTDIVPADSATLERMLVNDEDINITVKELTIAMRSKPFARDKEIDSLASYARTAASKNQMVVKSYKIGDVNENFAYIMENMRLQSLCKALAVEFNTFSKNEPQIDFITAACLKSPSGSPNEQEECLALEPFVAGVYEKYNNYCGYVKNPSNQLSDTAQAYSHFSFERSRGALLVCDLQGVGSRLSDPTIHTRDANRFKLAGTNLHQDGFKFFFASHVCNGICAKLGLKSTASNLTFQDSWPKVTDATVCGNIICYNIVSPDTAKQVPELEDIYWCDNCYPQIDSSTVKVVCAAPGPKHEFEVSKFLCEAVGRNMPTKCEEHRDIGDQMRITLEGLLHWRILLSVLAMMIGSVLVLFPGAIAIL
ncbi:hypothetical protein TWF225_003160 [Orbilia oligospora]|nr:hypothetical protein TWF225_003160 [Orbilia oligospora]KAF3231760.1 hypothetical protein TWF128_004501 [Orbilia oligospora]KAF3234301.1 hypothetical protein TWF217_003783 [Orbilia oligospora]KAF3281828.1 hypothetical protein TWF132_011147 [Orbilia oligospora]